jgi:hypothetical protein
VPDGRLYVSPRRRADLGVANDGAVGLGHADAFVRDSTGKEARASGGPGARLASHDHVAVDRGQAERGVIVRAGGALGKAGALRVTYGTPEHNRRFLAALRELVRTPATR